MQTTLAAFISRSKAASTSYLCRKEGSGDESELSGDDDANENQQSEEASSESSIDSNSIHTEQATTSDILRHLPLCWNQKTWLDKKSTYAWLICNNHKLGCRTCKQLSSLGVDATKKCSFIT